MAASVNGSWKIPLGHFLINGLAGEEGSNVVYENLKRLYDVRVKIVSNTCDGVSCNMSIKRNIWGGC